MGQSIIYPHERNFRGRLAIQTIREHTCGYFQLWTKCVNAGSWVDTTTGHTVCCGCSRILVSSGLRECDICYREFIDLTKYYDPNYEVDCPDCRERFGIDEF